MNEFDGRTFILKHLMWLKGSYSLSKQRLAKGEGGSSTPKEKRLKTPPIVNQGWNRRKECIKIMGRRQGIKRIKQLNREAKANI